MKKSMFDASILKNNLIIYIKYTKMILPNPKATWQIFPMLDNYLNY
jgi:hypothetical protein